MFYKLDNLTGKEAKRQGKKTGQAFLPALLALRFEFDDLRHTGAVLACIGA